MYYRTCPYCGANNDPGERCSCECEILIRITEKGAPDIEKYVATPKATKERQKEQRTHCRDIGGINR
jgi:hypothetical protein